jgi:SAM-dependent methyltransferase
VPVTAGFPIDEDQLMKVSLIRQTKNTIRALMEGRLDCLDAVLPFVAGKAGLEIGGPSIVFEGGLRPLPIYPRVGSLDNCDISSDTAWATHSEIYTFSPRKAPGRNIFRDASDLSSIADNTYDFILSSHNLEHFANPVKALEEWKRITHPGGALILVLPNYSKTFDRQRTPTPVDHMLQDFEQNTREDDLTHLEEILEKHDLGMDPGVGSAEEFRRRSLDNFNNRCLHHHVFDEANSRELLTRCGMEVLAVETTPPCHLFVLARIP